MKSNISYSAQCYRLAVRGVVIAVSCHVILVACRGSSLDATTTAPPSAPAPSVPAKALPADAALAPAQLPFRFAAGSPADVFASQPDVVTEWAQRTSAPGWGKHVDVAGGPAEEWLVEASPYALVVSSEAGGFWYRDFGPNNVAGMEARKLTGGPKYDVIATYHIIEGALPDGYRHEILEVWSFDANGPVIRLAIELSASTLCCGSEANAPPHTRTDVILHDDSLELRPNKPWRVDPAKFRPHTPAGIEPAVPDNVKRRTYRWTAGRFVATDET
jgi:hypothetical protein